MLEGRKLPPRWHLPHPASATRASSTALRSRPAGLPNKKVSSARPGVDPPASRAGGREWERENESNSFHGAIYVSYWYAGLRYASAVREPFPDSDSMNQLAHLNLMPKAITSQWSNGTCNWELNEAPALRIPGHAREGSFAVRNSYSASSEAGFQLR